MYFLWYLGVPFRFKNLFLQLCLREITVRTSATFLGSLWLFLQPGLHLLGFWFLLGYVLKVVSVGKIPFITYYFLAMIPWQFISESFGRAPHIFKEYAPVFQRSVFPLEILPWVTVFLSWIVYLPFYAIIAGCILGISSGIKAAFLFTLMLFWAPYVYILAVLGAYSNELRQLMPFLMSMLLYASPILYQPLALPEFMRDLLVYNPIADLISILIYIIAGETEAPFYGGMRVLLLWISAGLFSLYLMRKTETHIREQI